MNPDPPTTNPARIAALCRTGLPDASTTRSSDRLTRLAAQLLRVPVALVSLLDDQEQAFNGQSALGEPWAARRESPLTRSICRHIVETGEPLIINDTSRHDLTRENAALAESKFAACAGIPLQTKDGHTFGSFCVIDHQPRTWQPGEIGLLSELAACVMTEIALHQAERQRDAQGGQLRQKQKLETLGTLAAGIAHEFNNIIGTIIGNATLARQDMEPQHPARESLEEISKAGSRARALVQQVLGFARPQPATRQLGPLRPIVEKSAGLLRATLPRNVELNVICADDTPDVPADLGQVEQAILNLVINAWHALDNNPGRITLALTAASHGPPGLSADSFACITVSDTGKGMDEATLARVFEPFFTTKPSGEGTGLGLSIVHDIMQAHEGAVRASSQPGRDTVFTLYFPTASPQPADDFPKSPGSYRIWFLDDDAKLVLLATRTLERLGYKVDGFTDSAEALRAFHAAPESFAVAVTDSNMPGPSGIEIAARLRSLRPGLAVILVSGSITDALRSDARRAGIRHLIYKPNTSEELSAVIHSVLTGQLHP